MGKKSAIDSLSKIIANVVIHKILLKYTNKPESVNHLNYEVREYRDKAISRAEEFNWNELDKEEIKLNTLECFKRKMAGRYPDVEFPIEEAIRLLYQTMEEIGIISNYGRDRNWESTRIFKNPIHFLLFLPNI